MHTYLESKKEDMLQMLEKLVNIDCGSYHKPGIDQVNRWIKESFDQLGLQTSVLEEKEQGNHLMVKAEDAEDPRILVVAHMDTVFPVGTVEQRKFKIEGDRAYGPGVIDMKASIVALYYAIKALKEAGDMAYKNVLIFFNSDEEIGSISSRPFIEEQAKGKDYSLIMEPARADGSLVTERKGGGRYTFHAQGVSSHSGIAPEAGRSAIEALAYKVIQLEKLNDYDRGISVNVGLIEGGTSTNTVPPFATCEVDIRVRTEEQAREVAEKVEQIASTIEVEGTSIKIEGDITRPPMMKTEQIENLFHIIKQVGQEHGVELTDTKTGGGSDGNFTAALGIPTIDGLGPVGGGAHTEGEYLEIPTFVERTHILAQVIKRLSATS